MTGSLEWGELADAAARRELVEETGITQGVLVNLQWTQVYEILPAFGKVYAPGVTRNLEHAFSLRLPRRVPVKLSRSMCSIAGLSYGEALDTVVFQHQSRRHCRDLRLSTAAEHGRRLCAWPVASGVSRAACCSGGWRETSSAQTRAFAYESVTAGIADNAQALAKYLRELRADTLHLVGHSLGGLLIFKLFENGAARGSCRRDGSCSWARRSTAAAPRSNLARLPFGKKSWGGRSARNC